MKLYLDTPQVIAGVTLKSNHNECNNMALHVCEDSKTIINNRQQLAKTLDVSLNQFVCANQTHSANIHRVTADDIGRGAFTNQDAIPNTDALYTCEKNVVLCSFTADCVPVLFFDNTHSLIGAIHSGWQGTVKEITKKTMYHLIANEGCLPENIHVMIGTALSQKRFEVDQDVYDQFLSLGYANEFMYFNAETNKYHIDNQQVVKQQCLLHHIPEHNIYVDTSCTYDDEQGFSYRQDRSCGRHLNFIMQK